MATSQVDVEDIAPVALYPVALGIMLGVFSMSVSVFGGFDFTSTLFSFSSLTVTLAGLLSLAAGVAIIVTNEIDGSDYEQWEYGVILAVFLFPVGHMLIPAVSDAVAANDIVAFAVWAIATVASVYVSYTE